MPDILGSLFSTWDEIHSFVLGVTLGLLVVVLWKPHRRVALIVLVGSLAAVFAWPTDALEVAVRKPWYFLVVFSGLCAIGIQSER